MEASFSFSVIRSLYSAILGQAIPSATGRYLSAATIGHETEEQKAPVKRERRKGTGARLTIHEAHLHNLKHVTMSLQLGA